MNAIEMPRGVRLLRGFVGLVAAIALSPVLGMVIVFAVIPALPVLLALIAILVPMEWSEKIYEEHDHQIDDARWHAARHAHSMS